MPRPPSIFARNPIARRLSDADARLDTLEQPDAGQIGKRIQQLEAFISNFAATLASALAAGFTAGSIASTGTVSANGDLVAGGLLRSQATVTNLLTTSYRVMYGSTTEGPGNLGYVPSSRRFKQDIQSAELPELREVMRRLRVVTFRYISAVEQMGDDASVEWGLIAEEVHALGLSWLVDYEDGKPLGVRKDTFFLLLLLASQDQQGQIDDLTARLDAAGL